MVAVDAALTSPLLPQRVVIKTYPETYGTSHITG